MFFFSLLVVAVIAAEDSCDLQTFSPLKANYGEWDCSCENLQRYAPPQCGCVVYGGPMIHCMKLQPGMVSHPDGMFVDQGDGTMRVNCEGATAARWDQWLTEQCGPAKVPGDLIGDGVVSEDDLLMLLDQWGECPLANCSSDFNGDGVVDIHDLLYMLDLWSE